MTKNAFLINQEKIKKENDIISNTNSSFNYQIFTTEEMISKTDIETIFRILNNYKNHSYEDLYLHIFIFIKNFLFNQSNLNEFHKKFIIIDKVINILELINFRLKLESRTFAYEIIQLNICLIKITLCKLKNVFQINLKQFTNNQIDLESYDKIYFNLKQNHADFLKESIIDIKITSPKNNFTYVHEKESKNYPFFLPIHIKLNKIKSNNSEGDIFLIKNLIIQITQLDTIKKIDLDPSNVSVTENGISLRIKSPLCLEDDSCDNFKLSLNFKSEFKKEFGLIFNSLEISADKINELISFDEDIIFNITY
jgi:hypothetical protein